jgi:hypothetical protein
MTGDGGAWRVAPNVRCYTGAGGWGEAPIHKYDYKDGAPRPDIYET